MKASPRQQKGLTLITLTLLLGLIGIFVLLVITILPIYLDHNKVANALKALRESPDIINQSEYQIRDSLSKRFNINYVYDVNQDDITVTKHGNYLKVVIDYEVARKLVGNLSVLAVFNDVVEIGEK
jgi:Domain of unknown function (DUF4845)